MSKLWVETYARNRDIFMKSCAEILFKFQWHMKNLSQELGLGPGFFSVSPLRVIRTEETQIWRTYVADIKVYRAMLTFELIF